MLEPVLRRPGMSSGALIWPMVGLAAEIEGDRAAAAHDSAPLGGDDRRWSRPWSRSCRAPAPTWAAGTGTPGPTWPAPGAATRATSGPRCATDGGRWGTTPNLAQASYRLADALTRSDEREAAAAPLSRAWQIADRLGAVPLRDRAVGLSRRARIRIDPGPGRTITTGDPVAGWPP